LTAATGYRACKEAGVELRTAEYAGADPLGFVLSSNLNRRHLDESQRAMVAEKLATMTEGGDHCSNLSSGKVSQAQAAEKLNVSRTSVQAAKVVRESSSPELVRRVEQGEVSVSVSVRLCDIVVPAVARLTRWTRC
jgi:hypothetical protein